MEAHFETSVLPTPAIYRFLAHVPLTWHSFNPLDEHSNQTTSQHSKPLMGLARFFRASARQDYKGRSGRQAARWGFISSSVCQICREGSGIRHKMVRFKMTKCIVFYPSCILQIPRFFPTISAAPGPPPKDPKNVSL